MKRTLIILSLLLAAAGCDRAREDKLTAELAAARQRIILLEAEVKELKATAQCHFRLGQDQLAAKKYADAAASFRTVVRDYPQDPLAAHAKVQLAAAQKALALELKLKAAEEAAARRAKEAKEAEEGEPIDYKAFYSRMNKDIPVGKRYRFTACLSQPPHCLSEHTAARDNLTCSVYNEFDDSGEYAGFTAAGQEYCGPMVAAMTYSGQIAVYRLH